MKLNIKHDKNHNKFFTIFGGKECNLKYDKINDNLLDFRMMFVPKNLRNQGIGKQVLQEAFKFVKLNFMKVKPTCSYVKSYIEENPELEEFVYKPEKAEAV